MSPGMTDEGFAHVEVPSTAMEVTNGNGAVKEHDDSHVVVVGAGPAGLMLA
jgi:threonine dehydrogenase-like Zn-dependent dehydrogenase